MNDKFLWSIGSLIIKFCDSLEVLGVCPIIRLSKFMRSPRFIGHYSAYMKLVGFLFTDIIYFTLISSLTLFHFNLEIQC